MHFQAFPRISPHFFLIPPIQNIRFPEPKKEKQPTSSPYQRNNPTVKKEKKKKNIVRTKTRKKHRNFIQYLVYVTLPTATTSNRMRASKPKKSSSSSPSALSPSSPKGVFAEGRGLLSLKPQWVLAKWSHLCANAKKPLQFLFVRPGCAVIHPDLGIQPDKMCYTDSGYCFFEFCGEKLYVHHCAWVHANEGRFPFPGK